MDEGVAETKVPCVVSIVHVSAVKHETPSRLVTAELLHRGQNLLTSLFFRDFFGLSSTPIKFVDDAQNQEWAQRGEGRLKLQITQRDESNRIVTDNGGNSEVTHVESYQGRENVLALSSRLLSTSL